MNPQIKTVVFWVVIVLSAFFLWQVVKVGGGSRKIPEISYSAFLSQVESGNVSGVTIRKNQVTSRCLDNNKCPMGEGIFTVTVPSSQEGMLQILHQNKVDIVVKEDTGGWPPWLLNLAPLILLAALWFFMIRQIKQARQRPQT